MGFAIFIVFAVGAALIGVGVYWRLKTGVFCEGCKRPVDRCSCVEDAHDLERLRQENAARRRKLFDN